MKNYFISVIVPTLNNGRFIRFAIESLLHQTYPAELREIIVVDDGSTDNTYEILKEYAGKIIYFYQENKGIASARNIGISMAKGEIITFLDADDMWHEERLKKVADKFIKRQDIGMVYHPVELIDSNGTTIYKNFHKTFGYKENLRGRLTNEIFSSHIFCGGSSFAFIREVIDNVYPIPEDIRRGIDYYITAVSSCSAQLEYIPDVLGKYRLHGSNTTMLAGQENYRELATVNQDFAYMRQKVIEKILDFKTLNIERIDINIIKRIQAKEIIFYNVLTERRLEGIKHIPSLFKGKLSIQDLFKGITASFLAIFAPSFLYPKLIQLYGHLTQLRIIRF